MGDQEHDIRVHNKHLTQCYVLCNFRDITIEDHVIEDIGAAADELEKITERLIRSVGISAAESMMMTEKVVIK